MEHKFPFPPESIFEFGRVDEEESVVHCYLGTSTAEKSKLSALVVR
jgi:hypothetical protein